MGRPTGVAFPWRWLAARPIWLLLVVQTGLLGWAATRHSPGIDEVGHLAAGLHHWKTGTFDLYRVNPPLVRLWATAPLALVGIDLPKGSIDLGPASRAEFRLGWDLFNLHGGDTFRYLTWARWACLPFAWLATVVIYRWGSELYRSAAAGLLAAGLWVFGPMVLANGQMITPDTGAAAFGTAACYLFWRWLREPGWGNALVTGFVLGLAELCKATWVILIPLLPLLWVVYRAGSGATWKCRGREAVRMAVGGLLAWFILNAGYGFEDVGRKLGEFEFISQTLTAETAPGRRTNVFAGTTVGELRVPVPANYVQGIDVQKRDFDNKIWSYLRGEWRLGGWWYYYLYGLLVKAPLGTLFLAVLAFLSSAFLRIVGASWRDELVLLAPGLVVLGFVSSQTGFNHHMRYVLPAFPFLFIFTGRLAACPVRFRRLWLGVVSAAFLATVASGLRVYPHSMSYFNELAGGPMNGSAHLLDSNIDWGQDLLYLRDWYVSHPDARPFHLAYFGKVDPQTAGIEYLMPPRGPFGPDEPSSRVGLSGPQPGWFAVSVGYLRGIRFSAPTGKGGAMSIGQSHFSYFLRFQPVATAGYSIWIYYITPEECNRVRAELGLAPINQGGTTR